MGRLDFAAMPTDVSPAEIVSQDENNIGFGRSVCSIGGRVHQNCEHTQDPISILHIHRSFYFAN